MTNSTHKTDSNKDEKGQRIAESGQKQGQQNQSSETKHPGQHDQANRNPGQQSGSNPGNNSVGRKEGSKS